MWEVKESGRSFTKSRESRASTQRSLPNKRTTRQKASWPLVLLNSTPPNGTQTVTCTTGTLRCGIKRTLTLSHERWKGETGSETGVPRLKKAGPH